MTDTAEWPHSVPAESGRKVGAPPVSVLVVDDDELVRGLLVDSLSDTGYQVSFAISAEDALASMRANEYDLVLSDVKLPGMDGISLSRTLAETRPGLPIVLITGYAHTSLARAALQQGASDFITKPIQLDTLAIVVERNLERTRLERARAAVHDHRVRIKSIQVLAAAIDARQSYTAQHSRRVAALTAVVGARIGLSAEERRMLDLAAQVHDVGKIGVPDSVLNKVGPLTTQEWETMRLHPVQGALIVSQVEELADIADVVRSHHERIDGTGYPDGLSGDSIPKLSRIIAVTDAFEAMTSSRAYREALEVEDAIQRLIDNAGTQFDADITNVFCTLHKKGLVW